MKHGFQIFLLIIISVFFSTNASAQGCSDAGFCTLNSFKPNNQSDFGSQFKLGLSFGGADKSINTYGAYAEFDKQFGARFGIDARITSLAQSGNGISSFGLSDLFVNTNFRVGEKSKLNLGVKIPLADGNTKENQKSLPMDYQSSLGTTDIIAGFATSIIGLQIAAAVQYPLTQNKNEFKSSDYPAGNALHSFQTTNAYKRSGDVLLRLSYPVNLGGKLTITPSVLPIYHLANDKYTDSKGTEQEITGSKGLTVNGNIYLDYMLTQKSVLQLNAGFPFVVRDARPDGLTRSFAANLEYRFMF